MLNLFITNSAIVLFIFTNFGFNYFLLVNINKTMAEFVINKFNI